MIMTNEEKAREIAKSYSLGEGVIASEDVRTLHRDEVYAATVEMAEWKDRQRVFHDKAYTAAKRDGLTNKEFREMLEKYPDDAFISVECCNPRGMVYDKEYNLIRID